MEINNKLFDYRATRTFLEHAVQQYRQSAPCAAQYLDELYIRLEDEPGTIKLEEIVTVGKLYECGGWETGNFAQNRIFRLLESVGLGTEGMISY